MGQPPAGTAARPRPQPSTALPRPPPGPAHASAAPPGRPWPCPKLWVLPWAGPYGAHLRRRQQWNQLRWLASTQPAGSQRPRSRKSRPPRAHLARRPQRI